MLCHICHAKTLHCNSRYSFGHLSYIAEALENEMYDSLSHSLIDTLKLSVTRKIEPHIFHYTYVFG